MADLLRMLSFATRSLEAQRFGLDVVGQNIANVNTPGYSRRSLDLGAVAPIDRYTAGGGVEVLGVRSMRDQMIARRLWAEFPAEQRERATADALGVVEVALGAAGSALDRSLDDFFDAWAGVADDPTSATTRQEVVLQGQSLATGFHDMADRLRSVVRDTDDRVRSTVGRINRLAERIAHLNDQLGRTFPSSGESLHLRDVIAKAVEELSGLVEINVTERREGGFDVELTGSGRPLTIGEQAYALDVEERIPSGVADLASGGVVITGTTTGGTLGGLLRVRDSHLPAYQARLDELAFAVASEVNRLHEAGFDLSGDSGTPFFAPLAATEGAAAAITMNAALSGANGGSLVAASRSGAPGDNGMARQLAGLREAKVVENGTASFNDAWAQLVYLVGTETAAARESLDSRGEVVAQIRNLQDSVSGVSLDEEAAEMLKFQRAYEANARFFSTVDETLELMMQTLGG